VMIIGRGGGSLEDLWPFNDESVVRAVYEAETPIISAVGHEIDFALTDFAADMRAPTPSAAAEIVVQEQQALADQVNTLSRRLGASMNRKVEQARGRLDLIRASYVFRRPEELVAQRRQQADDFRMRLEVRTKEGVQEARIRLDSMSRSLALLSPAAQLRRAGERLATARRRLGQSAGATVDRTRARLRPVVAQLDALSPLAVLSRGYALAWKLPERDLVRDANQLTSGDTIEIRFGKGSATAAVDKTEGEING
jgi:exodeoxyribonuclease VII large subunit